MLSIEDLDRIDVALKRSRELMAEQSELISRLIELDNTRQTQLSNADIHADKLYEFLQKQKAEIDALWAMLGDQLGENNV